MLIINEEELLQHLKKLVKDLIKTGKFDRTDAYSESLNLYVEMKSRKKHYTTLLLQKDKYDYMITKRNSRYVCSTPQGVYSINPKKLKNIQWEEKLLPKTTEFGKRELIPKLVTFIPIEKFLNITHLIK